MLLSRRISLAGEFVGSPSVRREEAGCCDTSVIRGGPDGHAQECPLTLQVERIWALTVFEGGLARRWRCGRFDVTVEDGCASGWIASGRKALRVCEIALAAASSSPGQTPTVIVAEALKALRRQRYSGKQIAAETGVSPATVSRILQACSGSSACGPGAARAGAPLRARASRRTAPHRHQEARPLRSRSAIASPAIARGRAAARGVGWEFVHVGIDDASRVAFVAGSCPTRSKESAMALPQRPPSPTMQASASRSSA